jgi:hypothetical protein
MTGLVSLLRAACPILADGGPVHLVLIFGLFAYLLVLTPIAAIEAAFIRHDYRPFVKHPFATAFYLNIISSILGLIGFGFVASLGGRQPVDAGLSILTVYRTWALVALAAWLAYYVGTFLLEAVFLHARARKAGDTRRFVHALKVSAVMNLATYVLIAPFWFVSEGPDIGDATLVSSSRWLPETDEAFVYQRPDGELWLATTRGEQIAKITDVPKLGWSQQLAYRAGHDGKSLTVLLVEEARSDWENDTPESPAYVERRELGRFDLAALAPSTQIAMAPDGSFGFPHRDENADIDRGGWWHQRDGTLAYINPRPLRNYSPLIIGTGLKQRAVPEPWDPTGDAEDSFRLRGSPGLNYFLWFSCPNVLPGGRYVLFGCSGEIMVLDVEARKFVSLFPGYGPVVLSSLTTEDAETTKQARSEE